MTRAYVLTMTAVVHGSSCEVSYQSKRNGTDTAAHFTYHSQMPEKYNVLTGLEQNAMTIDSKFAHPERAAAAGP
jgi:hypothetical protein